MLYMTRLISGFYAGVAVDWKTPCPIKIYLFTIKYIYNVTTFSLEFNPNRRRIRDKRDWPKLKMYVNCKSFETRFLLFRTCRVEDLNLIVPAYKNSPLSSSPIKSEPVEYKGYTQRSIEDMTRILGQTNLFRYILCLETFHIRDKNGLTRIVNILFKISTSS